MTYDLTHARHDQATILTQGLFRSLQKGDRKRQKLDVSFELPHGQRLEFKNFEPLGADDARVLQGIIALCGLHGDTKNLGDDPKTDLGKHLRNELYNVEGVEDDGQSTLVAHTSYRRLAHEIGFNSESGGAFRTIKSCIERLFAVTVFFQDSEGRRTGFRLLTRYASDDNAREQLTIGVNPRIAQAIRNDINYARVSISESRQLGDTALILHQRLSGFINQGATHAVSLDKLVEYAFPDKAQTESAHSERRKRIRNALGELCGVGWRVREYRRKNFNISRPGQSDQAEAVDDDEL